MPGGWAALPHEVYRGLPATLTSVLLTISGHVGTSTYTLSHSLIAREAGCSVMTVRRAIADLQKRGLLAVEPTFHGGQQGSNQYRLTFELSVSPQPGLFQQNTPPVLTEQTPVLTEQAEEEPLKKNQYVGSRSRATPAPDLFPITDQMRRWWSERSDPRVNLDRETENFLDHHRARGSTFKDWTAAWRTWMTNAVTFAQRDSRGRPPQPREVRNPI